MKPDLPPRVYWKNGAYRYLASEPIEGKRWHKLGTVWDRSAKEEYDRITSGAAAPRTVGALLNAFLQERRRQLAAGTVARRTVEDNDIEAKTLRVVFGAMPATAVRRSHVATFLRVRTDKDGKPAPVRANREAALLSSAYAWAMGMPEWEIDDNPCYGVRRNRETPRSRYIETRELSGWKRHAPDWLRAYVLLKRLTGARQADMLSLQTTNVTDRGLEYSAGKTGRRTVVRSSWALRTVLSAVMALRRPDPKVAHLALFLTRDGTPMTARGFKTAWARAMAAYVKSGGERFREHDLRAKTASDLPTDRARDLLGHATEATTRRVYQRAPSKVRPLR